MQSLCQFSDQDPAPPVFSAVAISRSESLCHAARRGQGVRCVSRWATPRWAQVTAFGHTIDRVDAPVYRAVLEGRGQFGSEVPSMETLQVYLRAVRDTGVDRADLSKVSPLGGEERRGFCRIVHGFLEEVSTAWRFYCAHFSFPKKHPLAV